MLFSHYDRYQYTASPLIEAICQLRFPTILSIGSVDPIQFQELLRQKYPRYVARQEQAAPRVVNGQVEQAPTITNHNFISSEGTWKVNLTKDFIALSTVRYPRWEEFAARLDEILAIFIQIYQPAFFERVGLRYVNALSRNRLQLTDRLWDDLIEPPFIGVLGEADIEESKVTKCATNLEMTVGDDIRLHLQCGPGQLNGGKDDPEVKFILDQDYSIKSTPSNNILVNEVPGKLTDMHEYAVRLFRAAISDELHNAMGATPI